MMALDEDGVEELLTWLDPNHVRYCPIHRIVFVPDERIYRNAHTRCPIGGELLLSWAARFRDQDGGPVPGIEDDPSWW